MSSTLHHLMRQNKIIRIIWVVGQIFINFNKLNINYFIGAGAPLKVMICFLKHKDTGNKNLYSLEFWISKVFKMFGHFVSHWFKNHPIGSRPTHYFMRCNIKKQNRLGTREEELNGIADIWSFSV